ncbi:hypothetical protein F383_37578 [Gossypium arboreum]|uniref:Uncharacterized protein n=1 Tax=Gossypium arboreum TaxID=29729 RepID=A0A0B0MFV3_GOSAR|nr:hypothetical protein F383_37578 [Gossypium arboreum]
MRKMILMTMTSLMRCLWMKVQMTRMRRHLRRSSQARRDLLKLQPLLLQKRLNLQLHLRRQMVRRVDTQQHRIQQSNLGKILQSLQSLVVNSLVVLVTSRSGLRAV